MGSSWQRSSRTCSGRLTENAEEDGWIPTVMGGPQVKAQREQGVIVLGVPPVGDNLHATAQNPTPQNSVRSFLRQELRVLS